MTPKEYMASLDAELKSDPERTSGLTDIFAFDISGENGGNWWIEANDGSGAVHEGTPDSCALTVRMSDETMAAMAEGELDGTAAFFEGRMTVDGDQSKMALLGQIFGQ